MWIRIVLVLVGLCDFAEAAEKSERTVILVSIDGLADYYFDDPRAKMPAIRGLAAKGARAKRMEGSFPTVTWPNHTTLVTGVHPGRHGVIGNNYYDREKRETIALIPDPLFDKSEIVLVPTVYDVAHGAGMTTAGVCWPASRNASTLTWQVGDIFDQEIFEYTATPSLLAEFKAKGIPYWRQNEWCKAGGEGKPKRDWMYTRMAEHILIEHEPNGLLVHLMTVDSTEHAVGRGADDVYWAIDDSDRCVRELIDAVEAAGMSERTTFFICADHGFITYTKSIQANVVLREEGLREGAGLKLVEKAYANVQGGGCFIYLLDGVEDREATIAKLAKRFATVEGVETVIGPEDFAKFGHRLPSEDPREPDLMLSAADGYTFSGGETGEAIIVESETAKGSHGYSPFHPLMGATFVASGAGIVEGVVHEEISARDVAPTMAAVLGLEMKVVVGRVLTEILKD